MLRSTCASALVALISGLALTAGAHVGGHGTTGAPPDAAALAAAAARPTPLLRGKAYYDLGVMTRAREELDAALRALPKDAIALRYRGMMHSHEKHFSAAFADFEAALAAAPSPAERNEIRYYFADAYFKARVYDKAAALLELLLAEKPDHADARCYLGECLAKLGRREEAVASFQRALSVDPKSAWAQHSLGDVLAALGRNDDALRAYRADLILMPHCRAARLGAAGLLEKLSRHDDALREYYASLAYHLGDIEAHNGMGRVFLARGDATRAYAEFARSLDFDAQNADARRGVTEAKQHMAKMKAAAAPGRELVFWRFIGWWLPALLVAAFFVWRGRRARSRKDA